MIGTTVDHYRITEKLGEGGMGEVYLAEDASLRRKVALKFLPAYLEHDETAQKRFIREARSAAAIDHPYICKIHEIGEVDRKHFIVMEYVQGHTLQDKLAQGRVPVKQALKIAAETAEAIDRAHQEGIVHRDLKPSNIMLAPDGHVKVMDFGLAKRMEREDEDITAALTREGTTLGTLAYMSPEQLKGKPVDTRSDIFSFGVVLYEMLTGVHPFRTGTQAETVNAILNEHPSALSRYTEDTSDILQHTVEKMLAKNPDDRYQLIHDVRTNLNNLSEKLSVSGVTPPVNTSKPGIWIGVVTLIVAVVGILWSVGVFTPTASETEEGPKSIAVLPFDNLGADPEQDYFSDGLTEEIIAELSKIGNLRIVSRTSVMRYKETDKTLQEIAEELGVATILEGSAQKAEGRVRIVAQLIDGKTDEHLWAERYERELEGIFEIQNDVARKIAATLKMELTDKEENLLGVRPTQSMEAYDLYLKGLVEDGQKRIDYLQQALALDPTFTMAQIALAEDYLELGFFQTSPEYYEKAKAAAQKALQMDPEIAEAHRIWTLILAYYDRDWLAAEKEYALVTELRLADPRYKATFTWVWYNHSMGRFEEFATEARRVFKDDPSEYVEYEFRNYKQAIAAATLAGDEWLVSQCYDAMGREEEAAQFYIGDATTEREKAYLAAFNESGIEGIWRLSLLMGKYKPYDMAATYARLGEKDKAFEWLGKAYASPIPILPHGHRFDSIRDDPRYEKFLRETIKLPEAAIQRHLALR